MYNASRWGYELSPSFSNKLNRRVKTPNKELHKTPEKLEETLSEEKYLELQEWVEAFKPSDEELPKEESKKNDHPASLESIEDMKKAASLLPKIKMNKNE